MDEGAAKDEAERPGGARPAVIEAPPGDPDLEAWRDALSRSRERRQRAPLERRQRRRRRGRTMAAIAALAPAAYLAATVGGGDPIDSNARIEPLALNRLNVAVPERLLSAPALAPIPAPDAIADARDYAEQRGGLVSFSVIDSQGRLHSHGGERQYVSASLVKALLLAAELQRLDEAGLPLDETTRGTLEAMITSSDNAAADTIYARTGDEALHRVAERAGMRDFEVAGYWATAQLTSDDMARFFARLDRVIPEQHIEFANGLLGAIVPEQRWGIPAAVESRWAVRFKGGWRATELGQLVHQAAELRRDGELVSLAVLTDAQPSQPYAIETVRGLAERLMVHG